MPDKQVITGNEPFYPTEYVPYKGITIYQEAVLRFMVELSTKWLHPIDCAEEAKKYADIYIKSLNT